MIDVRIWHSSRDAYHCAFRILRLLSAKKSEVDFERLRVLDMYLLFPSLLHRSSMPRTIRSEFSLLHIEKPDEQFVRLPSNASVFQDLRLYQNSAVGQLAARGLIDTSALKVGSASLSVEAVPSDLRERINDKNDREEELMSFLLGPFSTMPLRGRESIYRRAGLPTRAIAE